MKPNPSVYAKLPRILLGPVTLVLLGLGTALFGALVTGTTSGAITHQVESLSMSAGQALGNASNIIPLGFAFGAGMVSSMNACGFALLPAYLGLYLGTNANQLNVGPWSRIRQSILLSSVVTAGFILLFGAVGLAIMIGARPLVNIFPWIGLGVGVLLVGVAAWMINGGTIYSGIGGQLATKMGDARQINMKGYFIFGLGYGTASLSCTLPIFLTVIGSSLTLNSLLFSLVQFTLYGFGMGIVILALTLSITLFSSAILGKIRAVIPYVHSISSWLLLIAGTYIVYYWLTLGELLNVLR